MASLKELLNNPKHLEILVKSEQVELYGVDMGDVLINKDEPSGLFYIDGMHYKTPEDIVEAMPLAEGEELIKVKGWLETCKVYTGFNLKYLKGYLRDILEDNKDAQLMIS